MKKELLLAALLATSTMASCSRFKGHRTRPDGIYAAMRYFQPDGWDPTEEEAERARERYTGHYYRGAVEHYISTSQKPEMQLLAGDHSATICYWAWEQVHDGEKYDVFCIWNGRDTPDGELPEILAVFWLGGGSPRTVYEHQAGKLTELSTYQNKMP